MVFKLYCCGHKYYQHIKTNIKSNQKITLNYLTVDSGERIGIEDPVLFHVL